ncbi:unnamed protein product [Orchesella dallaii]|uniref:Ionotropic glutamate receptor L-glutamate and glycine-binding domain-containing protein n=1 Tax=Orchesella dallaii TaxID=48710 RepID=A0ABP1Q3U0_9HEXA
MAVLKCSYCATFDPDVSEMSFTENLLFSIHQQQLISGRECLLSFTLEDIYFDSTFSILFHYVHQPYKLFYYPSSSLFGNFYSPPNPKFHSSCWTLVLAMDSKPDILLNNKLKLGDPVNDEFIFVSTSEKVLKRIIEQYKLIDRVALKFGMFYERSDKTKNQGGCGYLVEPMIYNGTFSKSSQASFLQQSQNLRGRLLKGVFLHFPPYVAMKSKSGVSGSLFILLQEMSKRLNVTFNLSNRTRTPGFGSFVNGSWTGLIGELVGGRADFALMMIPNEERYPFADFGTPLYLESLYFTLKSPRASRSWQAILHPLTPILWLFTLLTYITFVILFIVKLTLDTRRCAPSLFFEVILKLFTILMEQPGAIPKRDFTRFAIFFWIIFCYVIGLVYKSNLVGYLTFTVKQNVPTTFNQLSSNLKYKIVLQTVGGIELYMITKSSSPVMQAIARRMSTDADIMSCLNTSSHETTACIAWSSAIAVALAKNSASQAKLRNLFIAKDSSGANHGSFAFRKDFIFQETMNKFFGATRVANLVEKWNRDYMRKAETKASNRAINAGTFAAKSNEDAGDKERPLSIGDLVIVFLAVAGGWTFSFCYFIGEAMREMIRKFSGGDTDSDFQSWGKYGRMVIVVKRIEVK